MHRDLTLANLIITRDVKAKASSSSLRFSQNLLSVPGQNRQPSTERMPEYLQRSRSDAGYYPPHSAESRGHSFESRLEVSRPKRVLTPKFRNRSENTSSSYSTSMEQSREESPTPGPKLEVSPASGLAWPRPAGRSPATPAVITVSTQNISLRRRERCFARSTFEHCPKVR